MPENLPLVSIVTPSFNQGNFIERTILSVLKQDYPNIEYIMVDAMSTDNTARVLRKYRNDFSVLIREKDKGQADALNKGFARSSGTIMAYLNADDCFANPTIVSDAVRQIQKHQADVVYGRRYRITGDGFYLDCYPFREFDEESIKKFNIVPQECSFWTRDIWNKAGAKFDDNLHFVMDYDMWLRFLQHGARFKAIDAVYAYFRWHESQKSQAIWRDVCLPEVEAIQKKYTGHATTTGDMEQLTESFYYGVNKGTLPHHYAFAAKLWQSQVAHSHRVLSDTPLDLWVYACP